VLFTFLAIPPEKPASRLGLLGRLILYIDRIQVDSKVADEFRFLRVGSTLQAG
jgi:hypothetical protein